MTRQIEPVDITRAGAPVRTDGRCDRARFRYVVAAASQPRLAPAMASARMAAMRRFTRVTLADAVRPGAGAGRFRRAVAALALATIDDRGAEATAGEFRFAFIRDGIAVVGDDARDWIRILAAISARVAARGPAPARRALLQPGVRVREADCSGVAAIAVAETLARLALAGEFQALALAVEEEVLHDLLSIGVVPGVPRLNQFDEIRERGAHPDSPRKDRWPRRSSPRRDQVKSLSLLSAPEPAQMPLNLNMRLLQVLLKTTPNLELARDRPLRMLRTFTGAALYWSPREALGGIRFTPG